MKRLLIILIIFSMFMPFLSADVVSLNSGGSGNVVVNPNEQIEGFFSGIPSLGPVCGNGIIESGEECDDGNTVSGDGCSSSCLKEVTPPSPPSGGAGGAAAAGVSVSPTEFNINLAVNTNVERILKITNIGANSTVVNIYQQNLKGHVLLEKTNLTLSPGETKDLKIIFVATARTGIFTGSLIVGNKEVPVSLNVRSKLLLFDSNIVVLNKDYKVPQGNKLRTQVTLIPMGEKQRTDVTLNYVIKDYKGKTYLTKKETTMVSTKVEFKRNFDTGILPLGKYIIGLQLVYPNGVAPSSAHFEVVKRKRVIIFGTILLLLIIIILIILIILVIILIIRKRKKDKEKLKQS